MTFQKTQQIWTFRSSLHLCKPSLIPVQGRQKAPLLSARGASDGPTAFPRENAHGHIARHNFQTSGTSIGAGASTVLCTAAVGLLLVGWMVRSVGSDGPDEDGDERDVARLWRVHDAQV